MQALIGIKKSQSQRFLENGMRIPVTLIDIKGNIVMAHKTQDKDNYQALQLGFGIKKNADRAQVGHAKGAKLEKAPKFLREVRIWDEQELPEVGTTLNPTDFFAPGDIINVSGFSKGKGYQGGVKRHGFHGGPKTHGQSDRHRAPGAIGSGTTPGRVYKGKRMAGNMGNENVTVRNLEVIDVTDDGVLVIKGLVPGVINGLIYVKKIGEDKKFVPLWKEKVEEPIEEASVEEKAEDKVSNEVETEEAPKEEVKTESSETVSEEKVEAAPTEDVKEEVRKEEPKVEAEEEKDADK